MNFSRTVATKLTAGLLVISALITPALAATATVNADGGLRIREGASTDHSVVTTLSNGTRVDVLTPEADGWYQISYKDTKGYVSGSFLIMDDNTAAAVPAAAPAAVYGCVSEGPLNVRSGAGTDNNKVGTLVAGTQVQILSTSNGWHEVSATGVTGFVSADYIATGEQAAAVSATLYGKVTEGPLNIRSGAGTDFESNGRLSTGSTFEIIGQENGWYQIEKGYVSSDYVRIIDAAEAANSGKGNEIAQFAKGFVGSRYVYGGSSPKGFDCSGLTYYVYKQFGVTLNRTASNQLDNGTAVSMSNLQPGDLVMFKKSGSGSKRASHVGIYVGGGQFVHASTSKVGVVVSDMDSAYYTSGFVGGRRIFN